MHEGRAGSSDFALPDADNGNHLVYHQRIVELIRPGGVIGVDITLWNGDGLTLLLNRA